MSSTSSWATALRDLSIHALLLLVSVLACILVAGLVLVATAPMVANSQLASGADQMALGIALTLGVVTGCTVAVFTLGAWRRRRELAERQAFDEAGPAPPREPARRRVAPRRTVSDRPFHHAVADVWREGGREDEPLLEKVEALQRRL